MNNLEHYEAKLTEIWKSGHQFGVHRKSGEPIECGYDIDCGDCKLFNENSCSDGRVEWLQQPYKETAREIIIEAVNTARTNCRNSDCDKCCYHDATPMLPKLGVTKADVYQCRDQMISNNVYYALKNGGYLNE